MSKTATEKPTITADAFGKLRAEFLQKRLNQFAARKNLTFDEASDIANGIGGNTAIDKIVDEEFHSSMCPDPTEFQFV